VLLCVSWVAGIAAAQQAPCSIAWSTAALSVARYDLVATSLPNQGLAIFTGFCAVDIFDASSGKWTTAALSVRRDGLAATSLPNQGLAIFAGGAGL